MTDRQELEKKLILVLDTIYASCRDTGHRFVICGSMSTYLQGCNIWPNDIDILALRPVTVEFIADLMADYEAQTSPSSSIDDWLSTATQRVFTTKSDTGDEQWYMSRWIIDGLKIEVAYIRDDKSVEHSRANSYIWENGPDMYPYIKTLNYHDYQIGVIPLELQLSTNMSRGLQDRIDEIIRVLNSGEMDHELLKQALHPKQYEKTQPLLQSK